MNTFQLEVRDALVSGVSPSGLASIVARHRDQGLAKEEAYSQLEGLRSGLAEDAEDRLLELLDLVSGWCPPEAALYGAHPVTILTISDIAPETSSLAFDLHDVLDAIGAEVLASSWSVRNVECVGIGSGALHAVAETDRRISGAELLRLAHGVDQVIDGEFRGFEAGFLQPWIAIYAVDSSAYDVVTDRSAVVAVLRARFSCTTEQRREARER